MNSTDLRRGETSAWEPTRDRLSFSNAKPVGAPRGGARRAAGPIGASPRGGRQAANRSREDGAGAGGAAGVRRRAIRQSRGGRRPPARGPSLRASPASIGADAGGPTATGRSGSRKTPPGAGGR